MAGEKPKPALAPPSDNRLSIFQIPGLFDQPAVAFRLFQAGRFDRVQKALEKMTREFPQVPRPLRDPVAARIRENVARLTLNRLAGAVESGFRAVSKIPQARYLEALRRRDRLAKLVASARAAVSQAGLLPPANVSPRLVSGGKAVVDDDNTYWLANLNALRSVFRFAARGPAVPVRNGNDPVAKQLNAWQELGLAAGNYGDLYDNRDNGHSALPRGTFPQLTHIEYGEQARKAGINYGLNERLFYNAVTIGNSSTAVTSGIRWRSLPCPDPNRYRPVAPSAIH